MSDRRRSEEEEWWAADAQPNFTIGSYIPGSDHAPIPDAEMPERRPIGFVYPGALRAIGRLKKGTKRQAKPPKRKK